jgi:hypothetical protein
MVDAANSGRRLRTLFNPARTRERSAGRLYALVSAAAASPLGVEETATNTAPAPREHARLRPVASSWVPS